MSKLPLYRQIADAIKKKIADGKLSSGDILPTEADLRDEFKVSRVTVRKAIKRLVDQQILESRQGSGTYVKGIRINYDIYQLTSFIEKIENLNVSTHCEVLAFEIQYPNEQIAQELAINLDERVYYVKRIRFINSNPVNLEETWMPLTLFPDLSFEVMQGSKYHFIEDVKKLTIDRSEQEIIPVIASLEINQKLRISNNTPILEKITKGFLTDGTIFEYSHNYFKVTDYKFTLIAKRAKKHA